MIRGLGTVINAAAIIAGGIVGMFGGKAIKESYQEMVLRATSIAIMFSGAAGALSRMLAVGDGGVLDSGGTINIVVSLALGALTGEIIDIDGFFERLGVWLRHKSGSDGDNKFIDGFVTASLTCGIGAMGIMGSIQDGIYGDYSILAAKATIDFVLLIVMASSMGKGCIFSALTVAVLQGTMTAIAAGLSGVMTEPVLDALTMTGGILIFCIGFNLMWPKMIRVANLLPALVVTVIIALL